jgi:hypothetical protein
MKRIDLIRHRERCGCEFLREGNDHSVSVNLAARKSSSMPHHREIDDFLARKICAGRQIVSRCDRHFGGSDLFLSNEIDNGIRRRFAADR